MSVWLTIPSARPPEEANPVLQKWAAMGYGIALWREGDYDLEFNGPNVFIIAKEEYPGYAVAVNRLIAELLHARSDAEFFVIGGDDVLPDPNHTADEIAGECRAHFYALACFQHRTCGCITCKDRVETFGVMQPTGDRYANGQIDGICGSAWIGREFAKRVNQGKGPLWPEYTHMFVDQELQEVALKYGVLWQRPDLTQLHMQYCRESSAIDAQPVDGARPPAHITHDGYTQEHWAKFEKLFLMRKAEGFPGSKLL